MDTLSTLAQKTSTDHILACAALELLITLEQLFKLESLVKLLNMILFGLRCLSCRHLYIFVQTHYFVVERPSQSNFHGLKECKSWTIL